MTNFKRVGSMMTVLGLLATTVSWAGSTDANINGSGNPLWLRLTAPARELGLKIGETVAKNWPKNAAELAKDLTILGGAAVAPIPGAVPMVAPYVLPSVIEESRGLVKAVVAATESSLPSIVQIVPVAGGPIIGALPSKPAN